MKGLIRSINYPAEFCRSSSVAAVLENIKSEHGGQKLIITYNDFADLRKCQQKSVIVVRIKRHKTECKITLHKLTEIRGGRDENII